jgi:hypothetical protein
MSTYGKSTSRRTRIGAYQRTQSSEKVGADKASEKRQRLDNEASAKRAGLEIVETGILNDSGEKTALARPSNPNHSLTTEIDS